ncbi:uncharacterized protein LOC141620161 [Silene latifolia]|uniref:uncharacterized protein LOC141620161 n=1 Tax=Silene latifolia TaxID=37657 RepID=UPI003D786A1E
MRKFNLKMNPLKCVFGVSAGNFLGFLIHQRGIKIDNNKAKAVINAKPPSNKTELQRFLGQVTYVRRFIANLAGKTKVFSPLLQLKKEDAFVWNNSHQERAMKGQVLVDFLIEHPSFGIETSDNNSGTPWEMYFDGSFTSNGSGVGVVISSPKGREWKLTVTFHGQGTNNKVEYETLITGLEKLIELGALYVRILGDSQLDHQGVLLKYLGVDDALLVMEEVHEGVCGAHQSGPKMRWLIHCHGFYWPSILENCVTYAKGCKSCQRYGQVSRAPANDLKPIIKPWPFCCWAMDMIGEITLPSSKGHKYVVVVTGYFTNWVEAKPFRTVKTQDLVDFLKEFTFIRFGTIGHTPYQLIFGHDAVILAEVIVESTPILSQNSMDLGYYVESMNIANLDIEHLREQAFTNLLRNKIKSAKTYNARVKAKYFLEGDLVWKVILLEGHKDHFYGKWSPIWEGPFKVDKVFSGNAYGLQNFDGTQFKRGINGKFLKFYHPTIWEKYAANIKAQYAEIWDNMGALH